MLELDDASRQILWNLDSPVNVVVMYLLLAVSLGIAAVGIWSRVILWSSGRADDEYQRLSIPSLSTRMLDLARTGLLQSKTVKKPLPALAHTLVYFGFLVLLFTTTMVLVHHDLGIEIYQGRFYLAVTLLSDIFGLGLIIGCALFAHRRYVVRADLVHNRLADGFLLWVLVLLCVQGFVLEGLRIHATNDPWAAYSPVGWAIAQLLWPLSVPATKLLHFVVWWFHAITVFAALALFPYTKLFHIVASSANLFFERRMRPMGRIKSPGDIEQIIESGEEVTFGLGSLQDYSWKQLMDLDACTSCGRCQEACPAYLTGKPLSPKWVVLDTRNHALAVHQTRELPGVPSILTKLDTFLMRSFLGSAGLEQRGDHWGYADEGRFRAENPLTQQAAWKLGKAEDQPIAGDVMDPNVFWTCTTCMACVEACPVGINHVDQIIGNRQHMVLMQGEMPHEAQATLRAIENRANPYGAPEDRIKWLQDLEVRIVQPGESVDYLYWVGCVSAFDPRKQKIARSLVQVMRAAGLDFGILGTAEGCSGDPARRLGEENLFQTLAKSNLETLRSIRFKVLVANCPHCFNTIKNEYPEFGNLGNGESPEILHHSVLLKRLLAHGSLQIGEQAETFTFHDPCYLGRYNDEYDAPRDTLGKVKSLKIVEMERSRNKGLCCGAGGGHFWMDLKIGDRVNATRVEQAAQTGASKIATACPFCMQMLEDGVKITGREGEMEVRDIAEVIAANLTTGEPSTH